MVDIRIPWSLAKLRPLALTQHYIGFDWDLGVSVLFSCSGRVLIVVGQKQVFCSRLVLQCTVLLRWGTTMTWQVYGSVWVCTLQVSPSAGLPASFCTLLVQPHSVCSLVIVPVVTSNLEPK